MYVVHARNIAGLRAGIIHNDKSRQCVSLPLVDVYHHAIFNRRAVYSLYQHVVYVHNLHWRSALLIIITAWLHACTQLS